VVVAVAVSVGTVVGVSVGGIGVSVGGTGVSVGGTGVSVGIGVSVGGIGVSVGGTGVSVGIGVSVGGTGVSVGVEVGVSVGASCAAVGPPPWPRIATAHISVTIRANVPIRGDDEAVDTPYPPRENGMKEASTYRDIVIESIERTIDSLNINCTYY
jgi:hypothetical protein